MSCGRLPAAVLFALLLVACGNRATAPSPAPASGAATATNHAPLEQKLTTPIGVAAGAAVTQEISAAGGVVTAGSVTITVPAGALLRSHVAVLPITNTLSDGMQSVEISSDVPWSKPLTITMLIDATDSTPEGLGIAVQQEDGSWQSLEPAQVDRAAGTVSAALPIPAAAKAAAATSFSLIRPAEAAKSAFATVHIAKFYRFFIKPAAATVEVTKSQVFTPYARLKQDCIQREYPATANEEALMGLIVDCRRVGNPIPFTNTKAGFVRGWLINDHLQPGPAVGSVAAIGVIGATYQAPSKVPSPATVTVRFVSTYKGAETNALDVDHMPVSLPATVTIVDPALPTYTGTIKLRATSDGVESQHWKAEWAMAGTVTLRKDPALVDSYKVIDSAMTGSVTLEHCHASRGAILIDGGMDMKESASPDQPTLYGFSFGTKKDSSPAVTCGDPAVPLPMQAAFPWMSDACPGHELVELKEKTKSLDDLDGSRTFTCPMGMPAGAYTATLTWSLHRQNPQH